MNSLQLTITTYLKTYHKGRDNAQHYKKLAGYFEIGERELRDIVADIITDFQVPIGSCQQGYYFIDNMVDYELAHAELISRIKKLARRAKGLRLGYMKSKQVIVKQLELLEV